MILRKALHDDPSNASPLYELANVYLEHERWSDGFQNARVAAAREPRYRSDARLVGNLVHALRNEKAAPRATEVLRGFGADARPLLKAAAAEEKNPAARKRLSDLAGLTPAPVRKKAPAAPARTSKPFFSR